MKTTLKILVAEFERKNYKFIFNNCTGFTEMALYEHTVKKCHSIQSKRLINCVTHQRLSTNERSEKLFFHLKIYISDISVK